MIRRDKSVRSDGYAIKHYCLCEAVLSFTLPRSEKRSEKFHPNSLKGEGVIWRADHEYGIRFQVLVDYSSLALPHLLTVRTDRNFEGP